MSEKHNLPAASKPGRKAEVLPLTKKNGKKGKAAVAPEPPHPLIANILLARSEFVNEFGVPPTFAIMGTQDYVTLCKVLAEHGKIEKPVRPNILNIDGLQLHIVLIPTLDCAPMLAAAAGPTSHFLKLEL